MTHTRILHVKVLSVALVIAAVGCDKGEQTISSPVGIVQGGPAPAHGFLGIGFSKDPGNMLVIDEVTDGTPASASGISLQDTLLAINDHPVSTLSEVEGIMKQTKPGDAVKLGVIHAGSKRTISVKLLSFSDLVGIKQARASTIPSHSRP